MIHYCLLLFALLYNGKPQLPSDTSDKAFTIYLIRHAEKNMESGNPSDPELSACGMQRAENMKLYFSTIPLDKIYSTDLIRTKSTALPTATSKGLEIALYNPDQLEDFAKQLIENKENALVVGHSNTTAVLAGLLAGEALGDIDLAIYNRIYQVIITGKKRHLQLLHSSFECSE